MKELTRSGERGYLGGTSVIRRKSMAAYSHTNSKGVTYYLHSKSVTLRGGKQQTIYYFAKDERPADALDALPAGKVVVENPRNGFLTLKNA
jgi:hypothetical protein